MLLEISIEHYLALYGADWAEELPENCPPALVFIADGDCFYRFIISAEGITDQDWVCYRLLYPNRHYKGKNLIHASGLSIIDEQGEAQKLLLLPYCRNRFNGLARISLVPDDGVVLQTRGPHHFTWWRTKKCDLKKAEMI